MPVHPNKDENNSRLSERTIEDMIGPLAEKGNKKMRGGLARRNIEEIDFAPKQSTEEMLGISDNPLPTPTPAQHPAQDLSTITLERPSNPFKPPLSPPGPSDSLQTVCNKMQALAAVVHRGESLMIATNGCMLHGWDPHVAMRNAGAEGILSFQEWGELQAIEKLLKAAATRVNEIRAKVNRLRRDMLKANGVLERRMGKMRAGRAVGRGRKRKWEDDV